MSRTKKVYANGAVAGILLAAAVLFLFTNFLTLVPRERPPKPEFVAEHRAGMEKNPKDLAFSISTDREKYHMGEEIPVRMRFKNSSGKFRAITTRNYDRSGRMGEINFVVDGPEGGHADPLKSHVLMNWGGGLGGEEQLTEQKRTFVLNDYVRFDKPGVYHVYCVSSLVWEGGGAVVLTSPIIGLKVAEPRRLNMFVQEKTAAFLARFFKGKEQEVAVKKLAIMGTNGACDELVRLFGSSSEVGVVFGIIGCRDWNHAREQMTRGLSDPSVTVDGSYLYTLCHISFGKEYYETPAMRRSPLETQFVLNEWQEKTKLLRKKYLGIIEDNIETRNDKNLTDTSLLFARWPGDDARVLKEKTREFLARTFRQRNSSEQKGLLGPGWEAIKCDSFKSVLEEMVRENKGAADGLAELRLAELQGKSDEFRGMILADMRQKNHGHPVSVLFSLKDEALPEMDDVFLEGIRKNRPYAGALLAKHGTKKIFPEVLEFFRNLNGPELHNHPLGDILSYIAKHDSKIFAEEIKNAPKEKWMCSRASQVMREYYSDDLEQTAMGLLSQKDMWIQGEALSLLADKGGERCAGPVLAKLEELKKEYDGACPKDQKESFRESIAAVVFRIMKRGAWSLSEGEKTRLRECLPAEEDREAFDARAGILDANTTRQGRTF